MNKDINEIEDKILLDDERISRFLQGVMDAGEESAFLEELKGNPDLRQRATAQVRLIKGMKQADEELVSAFKKADSTNINQIILGAKIKGHGRRRAAAAFVDDVKGAAFVDNDEGDTYEPITLPSKSTISKLMVAASILLIFFVGFKTYDYYDTTNLGKEYANTFPITTIVRGEANESVENELVTLFENIIDNKNLDQAITRLSTLWQTAKQDIYNDYTDYAPYIGWYLAIAYLEDYDKDKAITILEELSKVASDDTILKEKSIYLLKKIK